MNIIVGSCIRLVWECAKFSKVLGNKCSYTGCAQVIDITSDIMKIGTRQFYGCHFVLDISKSRWTINCYKGVWNFSRSSEDVKMERVWTKRNIWGPGREKCSAVEGCPGVEFYREKSVIMELWGSVVPVMK